MKEICARLLIIFIAIFSISLKARAQQRHAVTSQQANQAAKAGPTPAPTVSSPSRFRLLAEFNYGPVTPSDLNSGRSQLIWNGTISSPGQFDTLSGYNIGIGYKVGPGFFDIEYSHASQELSSGSASSTISVHDSFDTDLLALTYDWIFQSQAKYSYEFGLGVGQAVKYRFHNIVNSSGVVDDLAWEDTPWFAKIRGNFNYHFSDNVRFRAGLEFINLMSTSMKADRNHPGILDVSGLPVLSGEVLRRSNGSSEKVDMSGFRLTAGFVVAF